MVGRFRHARDKDHNIAVGNLTGDIVPIHWLHTQAYCEYQLYLEKALGVEAPPTMEMLTGAEKHATLDQEHEKKAELQLTISEASAKAKLEAVSLVSRDIYVKGNGLYGRIDEVVFEPSRIVIIDDKPGALPYFSNRLQVWGYCQAFQEMYKPELPLFGALRQEDTDNVIWLEQYVDEHRMLVSRTVERVKAILSGKQAPEPTSNSRKCQPCRFRQSCPVCAKSEGP